MREFATGATRDSDEQKIDFEGFLHPLVIKRFAEYMHKHRYQADGKLRDSDNWQKGIPLDAYMKSEWRHFHDLWSYHRGEAIDEDVEEVLCALMFNTMGYLLETMKKRRASWRVMNNLVYDPACTKDCCKGSEWPYHINEK